MDCNDKFGVTTDLLTFSSTGWHFMRMLTLSGAETSATLLVRFQKKVT